MNAPGERRRNAKEQECSAPLVLTFGSSERLEVIAEDRHRFYTTVSKAAEACKGAADTALWIEQFKDLLNDLHKWCKEHASSVENCYVSWTEGQLKVFVTTPGEDYQFDFDDAITDLEIRLASVYPDCSAAVIQLPESPPNELTSFFSPEEAIQTYGKREPASG